MRANQLSNVMRYVLRVKFDRGKSCGDQLSPIAKLTLNYWHCSASIIILCAISIAIALFWADITWAQPDELIQTKVVKVVDGDTIIVRDSSGDKIKIRLYGIDAPEHKRPGWWGDQYYAKEADLFSRRMLPSNSEVMIRVIKPRDRYRRVVAIVYVDGKDLGLALVESGCAWVDDRFCKKAIPCDHYRAASRNAQEHKLGLWRQEAIEPQIWRRHRIGARIEVE